MSVVLGIIIAFSYSIYAVKSGKWESEAKEEKRQELIEKKLDKLYSVETIYIRDIYFHKYKIGNNVYCTKGGGSGFKIDCKDYDLIKQTGE